MDEKTKVIFPGLAELRARMDAQRASSLKSAPNRNANEEPGETFLRLIHGSRVRSDAVEAGNNVHQAE